MVNLHDPTQASLSFAIDVNNAGVAVGEWNRLDNNREIAGAAIVRDPDHPLGSTNKPGMLRPIKAQIPAVPAPGLWAEPLKPGSGFEINRVGDRHYLIWYTFDQAGLPAWYFSETVRLLRDGWRAELPEFRVDGFGACPFCKYTPPQRSNIGTARLELAPEFIDLGVNLAGSGDLASMAWHSDNRMYRIPSVPSCRG